jgi:hypothetical protein
MLQVVVRRLVDRNAKLERKFRKAKEKTSTDQKSEESGLLCYFCPICHKAFRSITYVDSHIFTHHPQSSTLWQAIRTPQIKGLTKTYDPISSQVQLERIAHRISDTLVLNQRRSELDMQYYFQKQLVKLREAVTHPSRPQSRPYISHGSSSSSKSKNRNFSSNLTASKRSDSEQEEKSEFTTTGITEESQNSIFVISDGPKKGSVSSGSVHDAKRDNWNPLDFEEDEF